MSERPVAFFDSGLGGLPYYEWAAGRLPTERFVYLADTANFPYGEKPVGELERIVVKNVGRLIAQTNPKVVVVACNTASVVALSALRRSFPIPFVGVVPAIKPAAKFSKSRSIGLLATARTVTDKYTERLIRDFAMDCNIARIADGALVRFVESRILDAGVEEKRAAISASVRSLREAKVDAVVLGCTHFVYLAAEIEEALGQGVRVLDSREGVAEQLARVITRARDAQSPKRADSFYVTGFENLSTGNQEESYRAFAVRFGMRYEGVIGTAGEPDSMPAAGDGSRVVP
ncbi:MAG TPA: glutamate racemase [Spirochaetia bacterium]|nr:glutamate racemase [Spirochaetia bacterium]